MIARFGRFLSLRRSSPGPTRPQFKRWNRKWKGKIGLDFIGRKKQKLIARLPHVKMSSEDPKAAQRKMYVGDKAKQGGEINDSLNKRKRLTTKIQKKLKIMSFIHWKRKEKEKNFSYSKANQKRETKTNNNMNYTRMTSMNWRFPSLSSFCLVLMCAHLHPEPEPDSIQSFFGLRLHQLVIMSKRKRDGKKSIVSRAALYRMWYWLSSLKFDLNFASVIAISQHTANTH